MESRLEVRMALLSAAVVAVMSSPAIAANCPIKLGGLAPLSAPGAVVGGEAMREAMIIAVAEINDKGGLLGCPVELVIGDTEGLPERGVAVMEKLINQDKVVAIGGAYHSSVGMATKDVAERYGVPQVQAETWNDQITASKLKYVFRIAPLSSEASAAYSRFAATVPNVKKVVIVTENTDYGIPASQETKAGLDAEKLETAIFSTDIGNQDFSGIIERVKAEKPDMIITLATGEAAFNFAQQAAEAGIGPGDLPFVCDQNSLESKTFWTNVPDGNFCFMIRVGIPPQLYTDVTKSFLKRYSERTGKKDAEPYALEAYDSIMLLAQAITTANATDGSAIVEALESIEHNGSLGRITFPVNSKNPPEKAGKEDKWWHQFPDPAITIVQYQKVGQESEVAPVVYPPTYKTGDAVFVK